MRRSLPPLALAAVLALAGCGGNGTDTTAAPSSAPASVTVQLVPPGAGTVPGAGAPGAGTDVTTGAGTGTPGVPSSDGAAGAGGSQAPSAPHPVRTDVPSAVTVVARATVASLTARSGPDPAAAVVATLANPIASGTPLVVQVVQGSEGSPDGQWLEVLLPVEPNGTTGWVRATDVTLSSTPYQIYVDRASYSLQVYDKGQLWIDTTIAVGTGDTPTPVGSFYLLELLKPPNPKGDYGPYAFGLSGFSEVLDGFAGADTAVIGIHGTNDPSALGTDVSHGCIRVDNAVITQMATAVPLGTPVHIT